jgi:hypothetical protein
MFSSANPWKQPSHHLAMATYNLFTNRPANHDWSSMIFPARNLHLVPGFPGAMFDYRRVSGNFRDQPSNLRGSMNKDVPI